MTALTESDVEQLALDWLEGLGWRVAQGPDMDSDGSDAERTDYAQAVLARRLWGARLPRLVSGQVRVEAN